jgi:hypothetical protein
MRLIIISTLTFLLFIGCGGEPDKQITKIIDLPANADENQSISDSLTIVEMGNVNLDKMSPTLRRNVISHQDSNDKSLIRGLVLLGLDATEEFMHQISQIGITVNTTSGRFLTVSGNAAALINLTAFDEVVRVDASQTRDPLHPN